MSGVIMNGVTITGTDAYDTVRDGNIITNCTVANGGSIIIGYSGFASNTSVRDGGYLYVSNGGTTFPIGWDANTINTQVLSGGSMNIYNATDLNTTVHAGGQLYGP